MVSRSHSFLIGIIFGVLPLVASAQVVINELMWMGTGLSTADEWIELTYIPTGSGSSDSRIVDGWFLTVLDSKKEEKTIFTFPAGVTISSGQYIVVSNYDAEHSRLAEEPNFVTTSITLPNTKLLLRLYDASGALIDIVDDGVGKPFAGENSSGSGSRNSMERIVLTGSGSDKTNWASASTFLGFDTGSSLFGTPGHLNGTGPSAQSGSTESGSILEEPDTSSGSDVDSGSGSVVDPIDTGSGEIVEEGSGTFIHPGVFITEVLSNPKGKDDHEWIEIGNLGTGSVSIAGWILDEGNSPGVFIIPPRINSGFVLSSGEYISFRKSVSSLPLGNKGEELSLMSGSILIDSWAYPETAEEVSYGRSLSGSILRSFCLPTESRPNVIEFLDPSITIQSGDTSGVGKVSINLIAEVLTGSLASASCSWKYSDGFTSESCNPPSHSFKEAGSHSINLFVETYCGEIIERELKVEVLAIASKVKKKKTSSSSKPENVCIASHSSDVIINEFLPNPYGDEKEGEWVELKNIGSETVSLCGWLLDDEDGGSKPFLMDDVIVSDQYLLLPRSQTKIALDNDEDTVRLFAGSGNLVSEVTYVKGAEGESMGLREDQLFVWTPYPTPEKPNRFRGAERRFPTDVIIVSAVLPNPVGKDAEGEWVELVNVSDSPFLLDGWSLDNKEGGSAPFLLDGVTLLPDDIRRFSITETGLKLTNKSDTARILDPDGYVVSILGWTEAVEGRIYRPPVLQGERVSAHVINVVDGDTIDIALTDLDHLDRIPDALKRKWLGIQRQKDPHIRVRLIGIDTPETVHPSKPVEEFGKEASNFSSALMQGQNVMLEFDSELFDKYERLLAYVFVEDDTMAQAELLRHGLAFAYLRFPFARSAEFIAYENEAKLSQLGLWSDGTAKEVVRLKKLGYEEDEIIEILSGTGVIQVDIEDELEELEQEIYIQEVIFSEVYPSPVSTGSILEAGEWIEIQNLTDHEVSLAGWELDDLRDGGSKPHTLSTGAVVSASGRLVLTQNQIGVKLNNGGDELWLFSPDGNIEISSSYPKVKKGRAYALVGSSWCMTDTPTPYEQNLCTEIVPIKRARKSSKAKKVSKVSSSKRALLRSRFLWSRYHNVVDSGTGETITLPSVWQKLKQLEGNQDNKKKDSIELEVLIVSLMVLPALRLLMV